MQEIFHGETFNQINETECVHFRLIKTGMACRNIVGFKLPVVSYKVCMVFLSPLSKVSG